MRKNKRIFAIIAVVVLAILSLFNGTQATQKNLEESEENYAWSFLQNQSVARLTLKEGDSSDVIQKISIEGEIGSDMTNEYNKSSVINQIKSAKADSNVKAILLSVNTPGGGVYESAEIYNELKNSGKDVYVSMKKYATSGGYYVSMAGKQIFANTETTTGSIGVVMSYISAQKYLNDKGIKQETIRSGDQKAIGGLAEDLPESTRKILQEQNQEVYNRFVSVISNGRNMSEDEVRSLADGRTYSATQALNNKLIDKIGTEEDMINYIKEDKKLSNPKVIEIRSEIGTNGLFSRLIRSATRAIVSEFNSELSTSKVEQNYLG